MPEIPAPTTTTSTCSLTAAVPLRIVATHPRGGSHAAPPRPTAETADGCNGFGGVGIGLPVRRTGLDEGPGAEDQATVMDSSRYTSWMAWRSSTPSAVGFWNALRPEMRPWPPA